jgi:hypothetical protein
MKSKLNFYAVSETDKINLKGFKERVKHLMDDYEVGEDAPLALANFLKFVDSAGEPIEVVRFSFTTKEIYPKDIELVYKAKNPNIVSVKITNNRTGKVFEMESLLNNMPSSARNTYTEIWLGLDSKAIRITGIQSPDFECLEKRYKNAISMTARLYPVNADEFWVDYSIFLKGAIRIRDKYRQRESTKLIVGTYKQENGFWNRVGVPNSSPMNGKNVASDLLEGFFGRNVEDDLAKLGAAYWLRSDLEIDWGMQKKSPGKGLYDDYFYNIFLLYISNKKDILPAPKVDITNRITELELDRTTIDMILQLEKTFMSTQIADGKSIIDSLGSWVKYGYVKAEERYASAKRNDIYKMFNFIGKKMDSFPSAFNRTVTIEADVENNTVNISTTEVNSL